MTFLVVGLYASLIWLSVCIFHVWTPPDSGSVLSIGAVIIFGTSFCALAALTAGLVSSDRFQIQSGAMYKSVINGSIISFVLAILAAVVAMPFSSVSWAWTTGATAAITVMFIGLIWAFAAYYKRCAAPLEVEDRDVVQETSPVGDSVHEGDW